MLFTEFVEGTGCRETEKNYQVYKELEIIYMNTDCTKEHIYEMGRKLVDNSKTEEELEFEAKIKAEIEDHKAEIKDNKKWISYYNDMADMFKADGEKELEKHNKNMAMMHRKDNMRLRDRIKWLKSELV